MGKFCQFLTVILSTSHTFVFSFSDDKLSQCKSIFTKLSTGMCIDIVDIWLWIADGHISSIFDRVICPPHDSGGVLLFHIFII